MNQSSLKSKSGCGRRCAAASLVGSMALQGGTYIQALGGTKLIKPLTWVLRYAYLETKAAAMRALHSLTKDASCCTFLSRVRQICLVRLLCYNVLH
jgi:hypothetical protein